ncbi:MAG: C40 family peptidase, partial [Ignavibacteriaceae bacterium]|nr:C40 family peptidase [Ignavibacteriaceae bacterium]
MALRLTLVQITFLSSILFSQINFETIFEKNYSELPFKVRIENCGIYSISSYDVSDNQIAFKSYDNNLLYKFNRENGSLETSISNYLYDAVIKSEVSLAKGLNRSLDQPQNLKKVFSQNDFKLFADDNGIITSVDGVIASVNVNPEKLEIYSQYLKNKSLVVSFPKTLAYASIIGIDRDNNHFLIVEEFESHIPLKVFRRILVINSLGNIISQLEIPNVKYLTLLKEFDIDTDGNLYHLYSTDEGITLFKISGLTVKSNNFHKYPNNFIKNIHFNNYVKTEEYSGDQPSWSELASSRLAAVKLGEIYVLHKYKTTSANLAPVNTTDPNGDIVRTPAWLIEGLNAKVPYKWGGFQTIAQFDAGLVAGKYAGDIHTSGVSAHAVGVDCSGFVSRCWQLTYHSATSMMPDITTQYSDWNLLKPGDAIHKVGHVRLFLERNQNGSFRIVEASARDWGVAYWSYTASDLATYTPRYYNNMESDFSLNRPTLQRAEIVNGNEIKLHWTLDTASVT